MEQTSCFHCGDVCSEHIIYDDKNFCCNGCKTVYEIFSENDLTCYYDLQQAPGATPKEIQGKYDFLSDESIIEKLTEFNDGKHQIATLTIPHIHCSSCIWILENLNKLNPNITASQVNFGKENSSRHLQITRPLTERYGVIIKQNWLRTLHFLGRFQHRKKQSQP